MRKRQVVPREILLDEVLGYKSDTETKALVMHIANLRKKMVQAGLDNVRIDTVVGIGYKLTDGR
jgi:DNA-binding response OmpR family regulator